MLTAAQEAVLVTVDALRFEHWLLGMDAATYAQVLRQAMFGGLPPPSQMTAERYRDLGFPNTFGKPLEAIYEVGKNEPVGWIDHGCSCNACERTRAETNARAYEPLPVEDGMIIREAVAVTRWKFGDPPEQGFVTFIDAGKTRWKRDPGYCYLMAGWHSWGQTQGGLHAVGLTAEELLEIQPLEPVGAQMDLLEIA